MSAAILLAFLGLLAVCLPGPAATAKRQGKPPSEVVRVMTRNVYLGADLGPGLTAGSLTELQEAAGQIVRQVHRTNFPVRSKALAKEILQRKPDLVGLQEVALWRTAPPSIAPAFNNEPEATTVRYDFLDLLLEQLNKNGKNYKAVVVQEEFDFETPTDENDQNGDGPPAAPNSEINYRLTMREESSPAGARGSTPPSPARATFRTFWW